MPNGNLTGFALPTAFPPGADHTYVESSHGHVWPCWGRSSSGRRICSGVGNTSAADCLAQPLSKAGVQYGVTGVCHQTANRILHPAAQFVSGAGGYRGSVFVWGTYGRDLLTGRHFSPVHWPWPELQTCRSSHTHP